MSTKAQEHRLGLYLMSKYRRLSRNVTQKSVITNSKQLKPKKSADSFKDNQLKRAHEVDAAEDDCNCHEVHDQWLSSWYLETSMSQKMVIEAKRKEMEIFMRMKAYLVVTRESIKRDEGKMIRVITKEKKSIQLPRHVS